MNQYPLIKGKTDLKTRFPEVAAQWDDEKNEGTGPEDVQPASMKRSGGDVQKAIAGGRQYMRGQPGTGARTARATRWTAV